VKFRSAATACLIVLAVAAVLGLAILPFFGHGGTVRIYADQAPGAVSAPESDPLVSTTRVVPPATTPAAPELPTATNPSPAAEAKGKNQALIRVGSWNVRDCAAWDEAAKERIALHDYVAATIRYAQVDLVSVSRQILSDEGKGGDIALLSVALAKQGWAMPYTAVVNAKGEDDLALFSRYKIGAEEKVLEPSASDPWPRPGIYARVEVAGTSLHLYGFHFKAMGDEKSEAARKAQALALARSLAKRHEGPWIQQDHSRGISTRRTRRFGGGGLHALHPMLAGRSGPGQRFSRPELSVPPEYPELCRFPV